MKLVSLIFGLVCLFSCGLKKKNCKLPTPKTIFYDYDSQAKDYDHYVLLDGFNKECMDSSKMVNLAKLYANSITKGSPALIIRFYSSEDYFIENEVSQPMHEINRNCLILIGLNKDYTPNRFNFYNDNGKRIYNGPLWRPNGE
jgi:hypothetical protein